VSEPCPYCDTWQDDDHEPGECMLWATGLPGADRRAYLREHEGEQAGE